MTETPAFSNITFLLHFSGPFPVLQQTSSSTMFLNYCNSQGIQATQSSQMSPNIKNVILHPLYPKIRSNFVFTKQASILLEILNLHVISWTGVIDMPPLIFMSKNFICIPLTPSFMHQEKSTISCSPRQEGVVKSPLTTDSPLTILTRLLRRHLSI